MNYFNEGCKMILSDFVDFSNQYDVNDKKSLIVPFLQNRQITESDTSIPISDINTIKKTIKKSTIKPVCSKSGDISTEDFNNLSIGDLQNQTWSNKTLVVTLKKLCNDLGLPVAKLTKTQLIESLIEFKTKQEEPSEESSEEPSEEPSEDNIQSVAFLNPKRRTVKAALTRPVVKITQKNGLNLVFCEENEDVILVLSDNKHVMGFIPKESYDENEKPNIMKMTTDIVRLSKNLGLEYIIPENFE